jgi:hypothetical protein
MMCRSYRFRFIPDVMRGRFWIARCVEEPSASGAAGVELRPGTLTIGPALDVHGSLLPILTQLHTTHFEPLDRRDRHHDREASVVTHHPHIGAIINDLTRAAFEGDQP